MAAAFRPKLGMGLQQMVTPDYAPPAAEDTFTPQKQQPQGGFFKEGGMGRTIAGLIGDTLLQQSGMSPVYAPMQRQKHQMQQEEAQWSRRRQSDMQDWQAKQDYEAAHPKPYRFQDNVGNLVELGPDGQPKTLFTDPTPKINYQRVNNPDGTFTMVPIPMGGAPVGGAPTAPVGKLTPMGGGAGNGAGGFPGR